MKKELIRHINIKIAISLRRLSAKSTKLQQFKNIKSEIAFSYNNLALEADIRKATVSDLFNAKSKLGPNYTTVISIIEAMGYKMIDFALIYDSVTKDDIKRFEMSLSK